MPSTYTGSGIELIADGEQSGLWGQTTNTNLEIINRMISEAGAIALSGTTHTLTISDGSLSEGQYAALVFGGSPSGTNTVTISPDDAKRIFFVVNSSGESVILTQGSGGNVTVLNGDSKIVYTDGAGASAKVTDITDTFAMGNVNIDGGTIDGVTIGGASAGAGTFSSLTATTADIDGGTIDDATIGGTTPAAGTFTTIGATTGNITTVNATTVDTTNVEVTNIKAKDGTAAATIADSTGVVTVGSSVLTTTDINGGTIDGTVIGGSSPAAISGTTGTFSGDVSIADKIIHTGDTDTALRFPAADTVTIETAGSEHMRVTSGGDVGIGTTTPAAKLDVGGTGALKVPVGTEAQRPTPAAGMLRFNDDTDKYEGYDGTEWGPLGGGGGYFKGENGAVGDATTGPGDIFRINEQTLNTSTTIGAAENASCTGPLSIASGVTLTVTSGGNLSIV